MKFSYKKNHSILTHNRKANQSNSDFKTNSDSFSVNSYDLLFQKNYLPISNELPQDDKNLYCKNTTIGEAIKENTSVETLLSDDEFMDLLPANGYFH